MASSRLPEWGELNSSVDRLLRDRGDDIEFIVLFGSRARGNWSADSDYDVLIGLRKEDGKRLMDRIYEFSLLVQGNIEVFPYSCGEWKRMFQGRNLLMLEALDHGVILFDRGGFQAMRQQFQQWRDAGEVAPSGSGWRIGKAE